jgi:hypothetical protein
MAALTLYHCFKERRWRPSHVPVAAYTILMFTATMAESILSARVAEILLIEAPTVQGQILQECSPTELALSALGIIQFLLSDALMVK